MRANNLPKVVLDSTAAGTDARSSIATEALKKVGTGQNDRAAKDIGGTEREIEGRNRKRWGKGGDPTELR